ncbi:MAG: hypothetical protein K8L91_19745 [Anaerolineae bacterium]|nr:hypothetical protein [Anaerolineae bacterium]
MTDLKPCEFCGKLIFPNPPHRKFCSKICKERHHYYKNWEYTLEKQRRQYRNRQARKKAQMAMRESV